MEKWFVVILLWVSFAFGIAVGENVAHVSLLISNLCFIVLAALLVPKCGITRRASSGK